ncbi:MAG: hypothetical protein HDS83_03725 [Bacteroidales bacterium]|nr:hypothetical protein [Bacteroidales bacterium]
MNRPSISFKLLLLSLAITVLFCPFDIKATDIVDRAKAIEIIDKVGPSRFEGLWQFTGQGATILILRDDSPTHPDGEPASYSIIMIDPVDGTDIKPGEIIGQAWPSAKSDYYDCRLKGNVENDKRYHRFTAHLNDEGHISFVRDKSGISVSLWRWIPYLFRVTVVKNNQRDPALDGCIKVYPLQPSTFKSPRYL